MADIQALIDDARCFESVREMRWPDGVRCPRCRIAEVEHQGVDLRRRSRADLVVEEENLDGTTVRRSARSAEA